MTPSQDGTAQSDTIRMRVLPPFGAKASTFEPKSPPQGPGLTTLISRVTVHVKLKDSGVCCLAGAPWRELCRAPGGAQLSL